MFTKLVHLITSICVIGSSLIIPAGQAFAAAGQYNSNWVTIHGTNTATVSIPQDNWTEIAHMDSRSGSHFDISMLRGERWVTLNQGSVGQLGLSSDQVSNLMERFPANGTVIYARYDTNAVELRINAVQVRKTPDGLTRVYIADFTPHHGERLRVGRYYMSAIERANPNALGNNPFQQFRGGYTDPVFQNISWEAAQVALGSAMAYFNATVGFLAVAQTHIETETHKSSGLFTSTVTTTYKGYAKPMWFVGLPWEMQPRGRAAQICAVQYNGGSACDDVGHIVSSGISVDSWTGGNMPVNEDLVYTHSESQSGWTILAFAVLTFALAWAGGAILTGEAGWSAGVAESAGATGTTAMQAAASGGLYYGTVAGAGYAVGSSVLNGGASLTEVQQGYLGSTGWGTATPASAPNGIQAGFNSAVTQRHITNALNSSLTGTQIQYMGNCSEGWTYAQCVAGGLNPGTMARPDSYIEMNEASYMKARYTACAGNGLTGAALRQCAAPTANPSGGWVLQP